jgi:hypothetical protein
MATDNAVSALGALLQHHAAALDADAAAAAWVAALPIKGDAVEAVRAHAQLVAMLEVGRRLLGGRAGLGGGWLWGGACFLGALALGGRNPAARATPLTRPTHPPAHPQAQDSRVLGAGGKHIPHLVSVMTQVRGAAGERRLPAA